MPTLQQQYHVAGCEAQNFRDQHASLMLIELHGRFLFLKEFLASTVGDSGQGL